MTSTEDEIMPRSIEKIAKTINQTLMKEKTPTKKVRFEKPDIKNTRGHYCKITNVTSYLNVGDLNAECFNFYSCLYYKET